MTITEISNQQDNHDFSRRDFLKFWGIFLSSVGANYITGCTQFETKQNPQSHELFPVSQEVINFTRDGGAFGQGLVPMREHVQVKLTEENILIVEIPNSVARALNMVSAGGGESVSFPALVGADKSGKIAIIPISMIDVNPETQPLLEKAFTKADGYRKYRLNESTALRSILDQSGLDLSSEDLLHGFKWHDATTGKEFMIGGPKSKSIYKFKAIEIFGKGRTVALAIYSENGEYMGLKYITAGNIKPEVRENAHFELRHMPDTLTMSDIPTQAVFSRIPKYAENHYTDLFAGQKVIDSEIVPDANVVLTPVMNFVNGTRTGTVVDVVINGIPYGTIMTFKNKGFDGEAFAHGFKFGATSDALAGGTTRASWYEALAFIAEAGDNAVRHNKPFTMQIRNNGEMENIDLEEILRMTLDDAVDMIARNNSDIQIIERQAGIKALPGWGEFAAQAGVPLFSVITSLPWHESVQIMQLTDIGDWGQILKYASKIQMTTNLNIPEGNLLQRVAQGEIDVNELAEKSKQAQNYQKLYAAILDDPSSILAISTSGEQTSFKVAFRIDPHALGGSTGSTTVYTQTDAPLTRIIDTRGNEAIIAITSKDQLPIPEIDYEGKLPTPEEYQQAVAKALTSSGYADLKLPFPAREVILDPMQAVGSSGEPYEVTMGIYMTRFFDLSQNVDKILIATYPIKDSRRA